MATYYVDGAAGNDSNAGTSAGSGNAWATIQHGLSTMASNDRLRVKGNQTYSIGTGLTISVGNYNDVTQIEGYAVTPGDFGFVGAADQRPVILATAAITGLSISAQGIVRFENFVFDGNSTGTTGVAESGQYVNSLINCLIKNWTGRGVSGGSYTFSLTNCEVTACGHATSAVTGAASLFGCRIHDNTGAGVDDTTLGSSKFCVINCKIYGNGGYGIRTINYSTWIIGNTIHNNGSDGIDASYNIAHNIFNNIFTSNNGYGLHDASSSGQPVNSAYDYNWFGSGGLANVSGARSSNLQAGPHDLSGDPQYNNAATGDFTPTNSAVQAGSS